MTTLASHKEATEIKSPFEGSLPKPGSILAAHGFIDPVIQRDRDESRKLRDKMVAEFDPRAFGALIVNRRTTPIDPKKPRVHLFHHRWTEPLARSAGTFYLGGSRDHSGTSRST